MSRLGGVHILVRRPEPSRVVRAHHSKGFLEHERVGYPMTAALALEV